MDQFDDAISEASSAYGIEPALLKGLLQKESGFRPDVISGQTKSSKDAIGIAQFLPATAKEVGIDPTDPIQSIFGAAFYLKKNIDQFGSVSKGLSAYNYGPGNVDKLIKKHGDNWVDNLPPETSDYLMKIAGYRDQFAKEFQPKDTQNKAAPDNSAPTVDTNRPAFVMPPPLTEEERLKNKAAFIADPVAYMKSYHPESDPLTKELANRLAPKAPPAAPTVAPENIPAMEKIVAPGSVIDGMMAPRGISLLSPEEQKRRSDAADRLAHFNNDSINDSDYDFGNLKSSSLLRRGIGDTAVSLGSGVISLGQTAYGIGDAATFGTLDKGSKYINQAAGAITDIIGDAITGGNIRNTEFVGKNNDRLSQSFKNATNIIADNYTPEQKEAFAKVENAKGFFQTAYVAMQNPSTIFQGAVQSLPVMATMVGGVRVIAVKMGEAAMASAAEAGLSAAAQRAAAEAAITKWSTGLPGIGIQAATDFLISGAQQSQQTKTDILDMDQKTLDTSPNYQSLIAKGMTPQEARESIADKAQMITFVTSGALSAAASPIGSGVMGNFATAGLKKEAVNRALGFLTPKGAIAGTVAAAGKEFTQEALQSAGEQLGSNVGMLQANPNQDLMEKVGNQAAMGGLSGAAIGAGMHVSSNIRSANLSTIPLSSTAPEPILNSKSIDDAIAASSVPASPIVNSAKAYDSNPAPDMSAQLAAVIQKTNPIIEAGSEAIMPQAPLQTDTLTNASIEPLGGAVAPSATANLAPTETLTGASEINQASTGEPLRTEETRKPFQDIGAVSKSGFIQDAIAEGVDPEIAKKLAEKRGNAAIDNVTGYFDARIDNVKATLVERARQHVKDTGEQAFLVDVDLKNLGGTNAFFKNDMQKANVHVRSQADILKSELEKTGGEIVPGRTGGDEFNVVVVNTTEEKLKNALDATTQKVAEYAKANGLDNIPHPKGKQSGIGLHLGYTEILPDKSLSQTFTDASQDLDRSKNESGEQGRTARVDGINTGATSSQVEGNGGILSESKRGSESQTSPALVQQAQDELARAKETESERMVRLASQGEVSQIDLDAKQASPSSDLAPPTQKQIDTGNFKTARTEVAGMPVEIEFPRGSTRTGTSPNGNKWSRKMEAHYGSITGTKSSDGAPVNVYLGPTANNATKVFIVDQVRADRSYDEAKVMIGYKTAQSARDAYMLHYPKGWKGIGGITEMPMAQFKTWVKTDAAAQPASETMRARLSNVVQTNPDEVIIGNYGVMPSKNNQLLTLKKIGSEYTLFQGKNEAIDSDTGAPITYKSVSEGVADVKAEATRVERRFLSTKQKTFINNKFKGEQNGDSNERAGTNVASPSASTPIAPQFKYHLNNDKTVRTFKTEKQANAYLESNKDQTGKQTVKGFKAVQYDAKTWALQKETQTGKVRAQDKINYLKDGMLNILAKSGGINKQSAVEGGELKPEDIKEGNKGRYKLFRADGSGMTLHGAHEFMMQGNDFDGILDPQEKEEFTHFFDRLVESIYAPSDQQRLTFAGQEFMANASDEAKQAARDLEAMQVSKEFEDSLPPLSNDETSAVDAALDNHAQEMMQELHNSETLAELNQYTKSEYHELNARLNQAAIDAATVSENSQIGRGDDASGTRPVLQDGSTAIEPTSKEQTSALDARANVDEIADNPVIAELRNLNKNIIGMREEFALANQTPEQLAASQTKAAEEDNKKAEEKRIADLESGQPFQLQNEDNRAESDTTKKIAAQSAMFDRSTQEIAPKIAIAFDDAKAQVATIASKWSNAPKINVISDIEQAPSSLLTEINKQDAFDARGAWHDGQIYLFPQNIANAETLERTIIHEMRHAGLEGTFGKSLNDALNNLYLNNESLRKEVNALQKTTKLSTATQVNEILADKPLDYAQKLSGWTKVVGKVKQWLEGNGFNRLAALIEGPTGDQILKDVLHQAQEFVQSGKPDTTFTNGNMFSRLFSSGSIFYSQMSRQIDALMGKQEPSKELAIKVEAWAKAGKYKADELQYSGLTDWLKLQDGKVTKQQVMDYLEGNGVKVTETILGDQSSVTSQEMKTALNELNIRMPSQESDWTKASEKFDKIAQKFQSKNDRENANKFFNLSQDAMSHAEGVNPNTEDDTEQTKFTKYQLNGGENYRELLLTLPQNNENSDFQSSHFEQPNILAHVRFNERTDVDGKRVLFIEELQGDWPQHMRKQNEVISRAVDADFEGIVNRMKTSGELVVECD